MTLPECRPGGRRYRLAGRCQGVKVSGRKLAVAAQVMLANDLALLFIMMNKPTVVASAAVFAAVNAALVALAFVPRRAAAPVLTQA